MANEGEELTVLAVLETREFDKQWRGWMRKTDRMDARLRDLKFSANNAEKAILDMMRAGGSTDVKLNVDDGDLSTVQRRLDGLDANINAELEIVESISSVQRQLDGLEDRLRTKITVDVDDNDVEELEDNLDRIEALGLIQLGFEAGPAVLGFAQTAFEQGPLGQIVDIDNASARLQALTQREIPDAAELINTLWVGAWADSRGEIAESLAFAERLGIPLEQLGSATEAAFNSAAVTGHEVNEVLRAQNSLVKTGLAESYEEASDIITTGFLEGLDIGDDFLDVINEYGSTFRDLGFSAEDMLTVLNNGLEAGFDNADRVADSLREANIRATELENTDLEEALAMADMEDSLVAFQAGELTFAEFSRGVMEAAEKQDESVRNRIADALFGTISEDFGADAVLALDPLQGRIEGFGGSAAEASAEINNTLGTTLTGLWRFITTELAVAFDETFGIRGRIEDFKTNVSEFFDALSNGASVFEAVDASFGRGFGNFLRDMERIMTDAGFLFLEAVIILAGLIDRIPGIDIDVQSFKNFRAVLAEEQLEIALAIAGTGEQAAEAMEDAVSRGVERADVFTLATQRVNAAGEDGAGVNMLAVMQGLTMNSGVPLPASFFDGVEGNVSPELAQQITQTIIESGDFGLDASEAERFTSELFAFDVMQARASQWARDIFNEAIEGSDFDMAEQVAPFFEVRGGQTGERAFEAIIEQKNQEIRQLLAAGDFIQAEEIANALGDRLDDTAEANLIAFEDAHQAMVTQLVGEGDLQGAFDIAETLGDEELIEDMESLAEQWGVNLEGMTESGEMFAEDYGVISDEAIGRSEEMETEIGAATDGVGDSFSDMRTDIKGELDGTQGDILGFVDASLIMIAQLMSGIEEVQDAAANANAVVGGGGNNTTNNVNITNNNNTPAEQGNSTNQGLRGVTLNP